MSRLKSRVRSQSTLRALLRGSTPEEKELILENVPQEIGMNTMMAVRVTITACLCIPREESGYLRPIPDENVDNIFTESTFSKKNNRCRIRIDRCCSECL